MQEIETRLLIHGNWCRGEGDGFDSVNPANKSIVWHGREASVAQVRSAFDAAREALPSWWNTSLDARISLCQRYAEHVRAHSEALAKLISNEMGKTMWEARSEAATVIAKVAVSIDALRSRRDEARFDMSGLDAVTRFKPIGVMSVLGPFNFPAHLPNGHIVPALLAGNTVVLKPSEQTPAVGAWMAQAWSAVGLPDGVLNLVQGGRDVGIAAANPELCDGLLFTGSGHVGRALHKAFGDYPQKILALEMGGNNPLVVHGVQNLVAAAYQTVLSAFLTGGQRCTCARRLLVVKESLDVDRFVSELKTMIERLVIGLPDDFPEPFYGPVINDRAGQEILKSYESIVQSGGRPICAMGSLRDNPALLSPGLIEVDASVTLADEEVFGPLLVMRRVETLDEAIELANATKYGLSAGLLCDEASAYEHFIHRIRAGIVNWNRQTTGASGKLPFGGCGLSGNFRPAGYYSADYCSFPVASIESKTLELPEKLEQGIRD